MIHRTKKIRIRSVLALATLALTLGGCSSPSGREASKGATGNESAGLASGKPSSALAKRLTPAGLAAATLGLFKDEELDPSQERELVALRESVVSAQRAVGADILAAQRGQAAPDLATLGASMAEKQHELLDHVLAGALDLRATLTPAQRAAVALRAKDSERVARRHATKIAAEGRQSADHIALAQARADILGELASAVPDATKVRALGSAFVASHARANVNVNVNP